MDSPSVLVRLTFMEAGVHVHVHVQVPWREITHPNDVTQLLNMK